MAHILIVDDERDIRELLRRALELKGHTADLASNGGQAQELVQHREYDLVLTDIRMPGMDGLELLRSIRDQTEGRTPCVIVTAYEEAQCAIEATRLGVRDFLVKPFQIRELHDVVEKALDLRQGWRTREEHQQWLEQERLRLEREVHDTLLVVLSAFGEQLENTASAKDHCRRVARATVDLARAIGIDDDQRLKDINLGAMLHDIGKLRIDATIWRKGPDEPLTAEDWVEIRKHPELGSQIVERVPRLAGAATIILHHHEKYDGSGYPYGLRGDEIPLEARVFQIIDAYDCMVDEHRRYKEPKTPREALAEIQRCVRTQFDPHLVGVFEARVFPRLERAWRENGGRIPTNGQVEGDFHNVLSGPDWLRSRRRPTSAIL